jgi:large subunit ribosomal protein L15
MTSQLQEVKPQKGAVRKRFKKGRGIPSGAGKTCGRGHRGQKCRSGWSSKPSREGGQTPLYRRIPKRQVNSRPNRKIYSTINLSDLQALADTGIKEIDGIVLIESGLLKSIEDYGIKVLGKGELKSALTVQAVSFSAAAKEAIEKAGGKAIVEEIQD